MAKRFHGAEAALNARRPTRDIDFAARAIDSDTDAVLRLVRQIASISNEQRNSTPASDQVHVVQSTRGLPRGGKAYLERRATTGGADGR
jgi:hypothetical protein